jgi:subfamily B ATP-binding cassette protein MsbA
MRQVGRLLHYAARYWWQALAAVVLAAGVGLCDAFRILLITPIFDNVLHPGAEHNSLDLVSRVGSRLHINLHLLVPSHFHNDWTVVAFLFVVSTLIKGICGYFGTYLANYAGLGTITDLREDLYEAILRRSASFFQKHTTGSLLSALITDIERVQDALALVLSNFLQQFFIMVFMIAVVIVLGGHLAWILLIFIPVVISSMRRIGRGVRTTTRTGQDKLAEIQNIVHETITGNPIVKAFNMEFWEVRRFSRAARRLLHANLSTVRARAISSPLMDLIGAIAIAGLLLLGRGEIKSHAMTTGVFFTFIVALFKLYDPVRKFATYYNSFEQAVGASSAIFEFMEDRDPLLEKKHAYALKGFRDSIRLEDVNFAYSTGEGE